MGDKYQHPFPFQSNISRRTKISSFALPFLIICSTLVFLVCPQNSLHIYLLEGGLSPTVLTRLHLFGLECCESVAYNTNAKASLKRSSATFGLMFLLQGILLTRSDPSSLFHSARTKAVLGKSSRHPMKPSS